MQTGEAGLLGALWSVLGGSCCALRTPARRWLARPWALACARSAGLQGAAPPAAGHATIHANPAAGRPQALVARACLPPILAALTVHEGEAEVASKALILLGVLIEGWRNS